MTNTKELPVRAPGGEADGAYYNVWHTIPRVEAGVMTNQARAKLSFGRWLEPGEPIVFTILSGSAVFAGGLKTATVTTDSFGCAFVAFSDAGSDAGEIKAAMKNNGDVSDTAPYSFTGGASSDFKVAVSAIVNDAPADGTTDDQGRALVTYGGGPLQDRQNVQFVFAAGSSAVFETDKPDVQEGSTGATLIVKTHLDEQGNDVADAYFHDASGEQVTLIATLVDHPEVPAGTMDFTFSAAAPTGFEIAVSSVTDNAPADGTTDDQGRALVTYGGGKLQDRQNVQFVFAAGSSAVFETDKPDVQEGSTGAKLIVKTHLNEQGSDIADAYFHDTSGQQVTLIATLVDHPEVPAGTMGFTFSAAAPTGFDIAVSSVTDNAPADGTTDDQGRALVTYGGGKLQDRQNVQFVFGAGSSAVFETDKPDVQAGSTGAKLIVKTHLNEQGNDIADAYFHDTSGEKVTLIATLVDHPDVPAGTKDFSFSAVEASFALVVNAMADNQPADGESEDQGRALVTENGGALQAPKIVKFTFDSGVSARFDTTEPAGYVQPNSSATVLYVKTHFDGNAKQDIADAYFTDSVVEGVTLTASLVDEPHTQPQTQEFQFTAKSAYGLDFVSMTPDGVPSDGISENMGRATLWGSTSLLSIPQTVKFELLGGGTFDLRGDYVLPGSDGRTLYVKTHYDARQGDVAYAYFTGTSSGATSVRASLLYLPTVQPRTVDFTFNVPPSPYAISLRTDTLDGVPADGYTSNSVQAIVTKDGKAMGPTDVTFALDPSTGARFRSGQTSTTVSTQVDEQGRDVADALFTCVNPGLVKLTATFPEYGQQGTPPAWRYFIFADTQDKRN